MTGSLDSNWLIAPPGGTVDVSLRIRQRLTELGLDQKDLAVAAQVTESYISQLLTRKKAPPAPDRTDIYEKMNSILKLPGTELAKLAEAQRLTEAKRRITRPPGPLFRDFRELLLRKCAAETRDEVRRIFEKEAFGELERLVTQKILEATQRTAREELQREEGVRRMADASGRSYEELRVAILEFLDTDILQVSADSCVSVLEPTIDSWDINLATFNMEIVLNRRLTKTGTKRYGFAEQPPKDSEVLQPGFYEFLADEGMSGDATKAEIEFLKRLQLRGKRPTPLYYYRELQNLRDPLHFAPGSLNEEVDRTAIERPLQREGQTDE